MEGVRQELLGDPKVRYALDKCQREGRLDFTTIMERDPETAYKLKALIDKGVLNMNRG